MAKKKPIAATTTSSEINTSIFVKGARMHNLKNIDVHFPKNKLIVVTGVSGSGKSSLTMDTLFAEGQRRYAESLSSYARQFLMRLDKPDVDYIQNICPAIAIEQKVSARTPRSTVGSMTELSDYIRLLYARIGRTYSPKTGMEVKRDRVEDVVNYIKHLTPSTKVFILASFKTHYERSVTEEIQVLIQKGFTRLYIPKKGIVNMEAIEDYKAILEKKGSVAYILIDRIVVNEFDEDTLHRIADSIQLAFYEGEGACELTINEDAFISFSNKFERDGIQFLDPTPQLFSNNNPYGACPVCEGFGTVLGIDKDLVIPDTSLSTYEGAVACWKGEKMNNYLVQFIKQASAFDFPIHKPIAQLSEAQYQLLWEGNAKVSGIQDFFTMVEQNLYKVQYRVLQARFRGRTACYACNGSKLRKEASYVKIADKTIDQLMQMPIQHLQTWFDTLSLNQYDAEVAKRIFIEIHQRLRTMMDVGLSYLTLERSSATLSGGESQRIQLTKFLGSNLSDSMYILDEPSIGLHARDTARLIKVLKNLRDLGNTVIVVEHDEMMMREADYIIDMGPFASYLGGEVIASGTFKELIANPKSLTGAYLSGQKQIAQPKQKRKAQGTIVVEGCRQHNLKNIDVSFPLGVLCVVSGVSGSGKTSLVKHTLLPAIEKALHINPSKAGIHKQLSGDLAMIQHIEMVDQNPIGKSSRSNPVTYIKAYDEIRALYAKQGLSKINGFEPKHFSFNTDGGRCDTCQGEGSILVEMQFLADVHLPCDSCKGKRFKDEVLEVRYNEKNIYDVLCMSVDEAIDFFKEEKKLVKNLQPLADVGLGYVSLGQSSNTLSGGEAQRIKLASFLGKGAHKEKVLFLFDEPTTGLHFHDIEKLLKSFDALIQQGHSIVVIEHNTDVMKYADWLIEIGPEGGEEGGYLIYEGPPEQLHKSKKSVTATYLNF
ncbi:MAG: excinuclease ABC subunit UvrA [Bacteroidota bacterium]|nr:excinuclease ABC subunit UvrA [Bacteroidota bacterium]